MSTSTLEMQHFQWAACWESPKRFNTRFKISYSIKNQIPTLKTQISCSIYGSGIGCKGQREGLYKQHTAGRSVSQDKNKHYG